MSRRQWVLGIGVGIMIGASLLQLGTLTQPKPSSPQSEAEPPTPAPLTEQQVKQWLQENSYAFVKQADWDARAKKISDLENRLTLPSMVYIHIYPGLSVGGMESLFVKAEVLPKDNHFVKLVGEKGLTRKIQSGVYSFEGQQTEEAIIQKITRP